MATLDIHRLNIYSLLGGEWLGWVWFTPPCELVHSSLTVGSFTDASSGCCIESLSAWNCWTASRADSACRRWGWEADAVEEEPGLGLCSSGTAAMMLIYKRNGESLLERNHNVSF